MCVHVHVYVCLRVAALADGDQRVTSGVLPQDVSALIYAPRLLALAQILPVGWTDWPGSPGVFLSLPLLYWGSKLHY